MTYADSERLRIAAADVIGHLSAGEGYLVVFACQAPPTPGKIDAPIAAIRDELYCFLSSGASVWLGSRQEE